MDPNIIPAAEVLKHNNKFIETIKIFVVFGCLLWPINFLTELVFASVNFIPVYSIFSIMGLINSFIMGIVVSAIAGVLFYFFYNAVHNWIKKNRFLSKHIHSMFTLFWKPFILANIISIAFGLLKVFGLGTATLILSGIFGFLTFGLIGFGVFSLGWLIIVVAHIVVFYFYAKEISKKLTPLYPW